MLSPRQMQSRNLPLTPLLIPELTRGRQSHEILSSNIDVNAFVTGVEAEFRMPLQTPLLLNTSLRLQDQFREKLKQSDICMLPSYSDALPTGSETGDILAADVGGSALRLARIRLKGRVRGKSASEVVRRWTFSIDERVRALPGTAFFDWMAKQILECLYEESQRGLRERQKAHDMGLAWSFPLDHISRDSAKILQMGKCFRAHEGLIGQDLSHLIQAACHRRGIDVRVRGIVNDGSASLLSQMYLNESTTMAVILGTGLNAAIHLPAKALSAGKLAASRPASPNGTVSPNIIVNTELSMFGKDALSTTVWDETLNKAHPRPDFQPMEHLTSGRYLGEIVRLIVEKACEQRIMFGGELPQNFGPYQLATSTIAAFETDCPTLLANACTDFAVFHSFQSGRIFNDDDVEIMRRIGTCVTDRAAAYMATAIHALWSLNRSSVGRSVTTDTDSTTISCLGSVLGKYPQFRERVQMWLDKFTAGETGQIQLDVTDEGEGALIGAAIAVALGQSRHNK